MLLGLSLKKIEYSGTITSRLSLKVFFHGFEEILQIIISFNGLFCFLLSCIGRVAAMGGYESTAGHLRTLSHFFLTTGRQINGEGPVRVATYL